MHERESMSKKRLRKILIVDKKGNVENILTRAHENKLKKEMNGDKDDKKQTSAGEEASDAKDNGKRSLGSQVQEEIKKAKGAVVGGTEPSEKRGDKKDEEAGEPEEARKNGEAKEGAREPAEETEKAGVKEAKEPARGAAAGAGAKAESPNDKKVKFDENQNTEHNVPKQPDPEGGQAEKPFIPPTLLASNVSDETHIKEDRDSKNIVAEGWAWKKRRIFACFWHQKYFVLTKNSILRYHKADGRRAAKGNWDLKDAFGVEAYDLTEGHPHMHRLAVKFSNSQLMLGFDDRKTRDYWCQVLDQAVNTNKA
jgi:hypothetical protein